VITVTAHAVERYIERIAPVDPATAYAIIASAERAIETAASFGAHTVKTASAKLIIQVHALPGGLRDARVVTVIPRRQIDHSDLTLAEREERFHRHHRRYS
jgi:hypothetical protein